MTDGAGEPEQYRVAFDFEIAFSNGGGLGGWDFRLDIEGDDIGDEALGDYIVRDLRLLMVGSVTIRNKRVFRERHKRAVTAAPASSGSESAQPLLFDLSPDTGATLSLPAVPPAISALADVEAVLVRLTGMASSAGSITRQALLPAVGDVRGRAVLIETGSGAPVAPDAAAFLTGSGVALVGLDGPAEGGASLVSAGVPVVGRLSGLDRLPLTGLRFSAVPPVLAPGTTVSVRAWARQSGQ